MWREEADDGAEPQRAARRLTKLVFGPDAINEGKDEEEGRFEEEKTCWGQNYHAGRLVLALPEPKVAKLQVIARDPASDAGNTDLRLLQVQVFYR